MGDIYITGDIHGNIDRFGPFSFPEQETMTRDDFVIVLGDFGVIWNPHGDRREREILQELRKKPFTLLFIDGNHECFDRFYSDEFLTVDFCGGKAQMITENVYHLLRGEIYDLHGSSFFCFGGAASHDIKDGILEIGDSRIKEWARDPNKQCRINHVSWYKEEIPSEEEMEYGFKNLERHNYKVDYILTHSPSEHHLSYFWGCEDANNALTEYLGMIQNITTYKKWYFGHLHLNEELDSRNICLYRKIIKL